MESHIRSWRIRLIHNILSQRACTMVMLVLPVFCLNHVSRANELQSKGDKRPKYRFVGSATVALESTDPKKTTYLRAVNIDSKGVFIASMPATASFAKATIKLPDGRSLTPKAIVSLPEIGVVAFCVESDKKIPIAASASPKKAEFVRICSADLIVDEFSVTNGLVSDVKQNRYHVDVSIGHLIREGIVYDLKGRCLGVISLADGATRESIVTMSAVKKELRRLSERLSPDSIKK